MGPVTALLTAIYSDVTSGTSVAASLGTRGLQMAPPNIDFVGWKHFIFDAGVTLSAAIFVASYILHAIRAARAIAAEEKRREGK